MKRFSTTVAACTAGVLLLLLSASDAQAQFRGFWLDIGEYHNVYSESGSRHEAAPGVPEGLDFPAILRESGHGWARAFWTGTKNWTNENGQNFPYFVARIGSSDPGIEFTTPVDTRIIARYEDTEVFVDGALAFDKLAVVDEVDPSIPADRMIINQHNVSVGVSVTRKIYAYVNQFHDNYHIIAHEYCNTGNIDDDAAIELDGQTLTDVYFYFMHRWRGSGQAAWTGSNGQAWGKFNMIDVVGDGHETYPVDFTAFYAWAGFDPDVTIFSNLGSPLWSTNNWQASIDTVGRLSGGTWTGRVILHADQSVDDRSYQKCTEATFATCQPKAIGWLDQDEPLNSINESHENYYELGILTRENPDKIPGGSRMYPHYADRVEPSGEFWAPTTNASAGHGSVAQGGFSPYESYGPYDLAFGDCIYTTAVEAVAGLSYDAEVQIGRTHKRSGDARGTRLISYDANGDGVITESDFDYSNIGLPLYQGDGCTACAVRGSERLTKNHWVFTVRDSMFQTFFRARDLYEASNGLTQYPISEAPFPPIRFNIDGLPDGIVLDWEPHPAGGPAIDHWEVYRTSGFTDNLLDPDGDGNFEVVSRVGGDGLVTGYQCIAGCPGTPALSSGTTAFEDNTAGRGTDYYYYVIAVGQPQSNDPKAINGTPGGVPLTSSRSLTQSFLPATLKRPPYNQDLPAAERSVRDTRIVPNPVNLGSENGIRFAQEDRVAFFNIPPECTIKIYTEIGELVKTLEHTDGSGDELWNLTTDSRQLLVSGIYLAVITDNTNGEEIIRKFVVIR